MKNYRHEDVKGKRFHRLVGVEALYRDQNKKWVWKFQCDCGNFYEGVLHNVKRGATQSCGCLNNELRHGRAKHGQGDHPLYSVWKRMRQRCNDTNVSDYKYYGGRGIKVCERWDDFSLFLSDMGERPTPEHTIDREDNNGNYEPNNCRWATRLEQVHNRG